MNLQGYEIHVEYGDWDNYMFCDQPYDLAIFLRKIEGNKAPKLLSNASKIFIRGSLEMADDIVNDAGYNEAEYVKFNKNPLQLNKTGQGNVSVTFKKLSHSDQCRLKFEIIGHTTVEPYFSPKFSIM